MKDKSTYSSGWPERVIVWWATLKVRPGRITIEDAIRATGAEKSIDGSGNHNTAYDAFSTMLGQLGFKRTLFDDGWFYVPPAKFALIRALPAPVTAQDVARIKEEITAGSGQTFTYFLQAENGGPIKIGKANDVRQRIAQLQTGNPYRLRVLLLLPDTEAAEREMHDAFAGHRIREDGEWFEPVRELMDFIEAQVMRLCGHP